jgi:EmrB/QacA subfamily drug resistance transporter
VQHKYRVFLVCATGIFVTVFDTSASIVALPTIAHEFGTDLTTAQWVIIGNSLTIAAFLVPVGRLSDIIGRKLIYVVGCALFASGAALAWGASSIIGLIAARCIVGAGSAMTQGTAMAILVSNFSVGERARMLGLQMGGVGLGAIAGPALGGLIVGSIGWRRLFAVTVFAMIAIGIAGLRILRRRTERPNNARSFDWVGAVLFSSILVTGLLTLTLGPRFGWTGPGSMIGLSLFATLTAAFAIVEKRHPSPMLDFRLFRNPAFTFGAIAAVTVFMAMSATRFLVPFFLQGIKGFDPTGVGMTMLPAAAVTAIVAPFAGRLADRFGVRLFANIGIAISAAGLALFATFQVDTAISTVIAALVVLALGMAIFGAPNSAAILNSVEAESHGLAAGFVNLCRNSGNVIGIAFGTAVVTLTMGAAGYPPSLSEVSVGAGAGLFDAFTLGLRTAALAMMGCVIPVLTIIVVWSVRARLRIRTSHSSQD